ncbi:MAG: heavy metal translocating P-type ATPase, partial [Chthoniobacterales bacterium]
MNHKSRTSIMTRFLRLMPKPCDCTATKTTHDESEEWRLMTILAAGCLLFGLLGLFSNFYLKNQPVSIAFYFFAYLLGGWDATIDAWASIKKRELDIHFLMIAVALGAASIGAWREGALLLFLFSASGAMEHFAMGRTKRAIDALFRGAPKTARVLRNGKEEQIRVEQLLPGMIVLVTSGEQIPADFEVIKGDSSCDESNLTGEATPVKKIPGDTALSGTINLWGVLEGRVLRPASESALQKIIRLIQDAQELKAPSQRFTDRFGSGYTAIILTICTIMFFVWWLLLNKPAFFPQGNVVSAFYRTMTLLVVASPCALVLSVPSAILSAIASGARRGILYRGGAAIETLADVRIVALDKTGTLTSGNLTLSRFDCFEGDEDRLKSIAYSLARLSEHPLSRAIRRMGKTWNAELVEVEEFETLLGLGVCATSQGKSYVMGSLKLLEGLEQFQQKSFPSNPGFDGAVVWIAGDQLLGRILFTDEIRKESKLTLQQLHHDGLRTVMLTGDHADAAEAIGNAVGVGEIMSGLSPAQKVEAIQALKQNNKIRVAMIGDGVNDAPCLAAADVGVAMGARGSDAALEQAEVVLMNDRIENFLLARMLSKHARVIIYQNIFVAVATVIT